MNNFDIRAALPEDASSIKQLALDNQMFELDEMEGFDEMLSGFFDQTLDEHFWIVATRNDRTDGDCGVDVVAAAYFAPEPFSDRMWNLYFIATSPDEHGGGSGTALIEHVEALLRTRGEDIARTLIVDTSSAEGYEQARAFYDRRGFVEEARLRDFYGPGDHKVTFWKTLVD